MPPQGHVTNGIVGVEGLPPPPPMHPKTEALQCAVPARVSSHSSARTLIKLARRGHETASSLTKLARSMAEQSLPPRTAHGLGEQPGQVIDGRRSLDFVVSEQ